MAMKVTIHLELTVDEDELGVEQMDIPDKIRQLCRDAFGEFQAPRRDAKAYVARRYGSGSPYCSESKVAEVEGRVEIARSLSAAISSSRIDVEPCCPWFRKQSVQVTSVQIAAILAAIEFAATHMDGPDEPGFHFNSTTVLDADPKTGLILTEDENGEKWAYKMWASGDGIRMREADESDFDSALERWQEKTGL